MTREFRITAQDFAPLAEQPDDCYIAPNDPAREMMKQNLGGLGSRTALEQYNNLQPQQVIGSNKGQIQREQGIKPGTEEWFKLWFGQNR